MYDLKKCYILNIKMKFVSLITKTLEWLIFVDLGSYLPVAFLFTSVETDTEKRYQPMDNNKLHIFIYL